MLKLVALVTRWGVPAKLAKPLLALVGIILLVLAILAAVKIHDRRVIGNHEAKQEATNVKADRQADASAAEQRRSDDARTTEEIQQVKEAVNEAGNDPAARRTAYYRCVRLQQAARSAKRVVPACG